MGRIYSVESVTITWAGIATPVPVISAIGTVTSGGWSRARLVEFVYVTPPTDGILDLDFTAEPPSGIATTVMLPITAGKLIGKSIDEFWGKGKALKGVRVHSASNDQVAMFEPPAVQSLFGHTNKPASKEVPFPLGARQLAAMLGDDDPYPLSTTVDWPLDASKLSELLLGRIVRAYHTGDMLTMGFIPDRVNIEMNRDTNRVVSVWLG